MRSATDPIEEARALLASGDDTKALTSLRRLWDATEDPDVREAIHELAVTAHARSHGFHRIEWHRLMVDCDR